MQMQVPQIPRPSVPPTANQTGTYVELDLPKQTGGQRSSHTQPNRGQRPSHTQPSRGAQQAEYAELHFPTEKVTSKGDGFNFIL